MLAEARRRREYVARQIAELSARPEASSGEAHELLASLVRDKMALVQEEDTLLQEAIRADSPVDIRVCLLPAGICALHARGSQHALHVSYRLSRH